MLDFQWAHKAANIQLLNPRGTAAVCCLWTPVSHILKLWTQKAPALLIKENSPLALLGGLYGGGLKIMLRNLHHNPQIDTLILCGKDFSGIVEHVLNFFSGKIERTGLKQLYVFEDGSQRELEKLIISGKTAYSLDSLITPELFEHPPHIVNWAGDRDSTSPQKLLQFLESYRPAPPLRSRPEPIALPRLVTVTFPSEPAAHTVAAETILAAWSEVLFRLHRFGRLIKLRSGKERHELLNLKAVIRNPGCFSAGQLAEYNLTPELIENYQADLLKAELEDGGSTYTYGHRLGSYFGRNLLEQAARDLACDLDSRHCYMTLWDNNNDPEGHDTPCLVSLFFRKIGPLVHLTAVFRTHNGARAWPVNCFGLLGLMKHVCRLANEDPGKTETHLLEPGQLTVISQSISLDPSEMIEVTGKLEDRRQRPLQTVPDPYGYFKITLDRDRLEIVASHYDLEDELIAQYRGANPTELSQELVRSLAVSDPGHGLYLGSQLERAWYCLHRGLDYVQDKTRLIDPPEEEA
jgi:thymidylate synthase